MAPTSRIFPLALALLAAGCLSTAEPAGVAEVGEPAPEPTPAPPEPNATLPDGRGESAGLKEANQTEEGVGGSEHKHDYWQGKERIVLLDRLVELSCPPCMPDGEGSEPKSVAYVKLGRLPDDSGDALVYEGADLVEVSIGQPVLLGRYAPTPHPSPPRLFLQHRSAADAEWQPPVEVAYDSRVEIPVAPQMTDMPHSTHSLWVFRLTTDRPERAMGVPLVVIAQKGREVVDWPGHPDFYAETDARVVMRQTVRTHMSGVEGVALYDSGGTWANPENLISWGTKEIHVFANVTRTTNGAGLEPTGYFLEAHNATIIGPEVKFGSRHRDVDGNDDLKSYHFALKVDEGGMDGPYQPASRWGFRLMALFGDVDGVIGLCPGCFPYDIEYDITVVALSYETGTAQEMERLE